MRRFIVARVFRAMAGTQVAATLGWHVYDLTGAALFLGILGLVEFLPAIPAGLLGGALADTRDRVRHARNTQIAVAACMASFAVVGLAGASVHFVYGIVLLAAACQAIERPALGAILPSLVRTEQFTAAVVSVATARNAAWALGPVVCGVCMAQGGVAASYMVAALFVLVSVAVLSFLPPALPQGERSPGVSWQAVREGLGFVRGNRPVLGSMTLDLLAVVFASVDALLPVFAKEVLHVEELGFGLLAGSMTIGTFLMALVMMARPLGDRPGLALLLAIGVFGGATLVFAGSSFFALSVSALVAAGMADQVSMVARETIIQLSTPDALRGRVNAVSFVFIDASNQLGRAESGLLAAAVGAVASVWIGGGLCLAALGTVAVGMPGLRHFRISTSHAVRGGA